MKDNKYKQVKQAGEGVEEGVGLVWSVLSGLVSGIFGVLASLIL